MKNYLKRDACISHHSAFEFCGYGSNITGKCAGHFHRADGGGQYPWFWKIAGLEEVVRCLMLVLGLKEDRILACLERNTLWEDECIMAMKYIYTLKDRNERADYNLQNIDEKIESVIVEFFGDNLKDVHVERVF